MPKLKTYPYSWGTGDGRWTASLAACLILCTSFPLAAVSAAESDEQGAPAGLAALDLENLLATPVTSVRRKERATAARPGLCM